MKVLAPPVMVPLEPLRTAPSFSIVICAYQAAGTVARAVRSALEQVHSPHEVIVVDDGSTDAIADALAPFGDRVRLIRKENGGGASARNAGATAARGDFLAVLDADDAYHERRLEALSQLAMERPDLDLLTTDARFVQGDHEVGRFQAATPFAIDDQRTAIFESCFPGGWPAVRMTRLRAVGGFDESFRIAYDWDCWLRLILDGCRAGMVDAPYYDYHLHAGSLSAKRITSLWERVAVMEKAQHNPALLDEERSALERALRVHRSRASMAEAQAAETSHRRRAQLMLSRGIDGRARTLAGLTLVAPRFVRRRMTGDTAPVRRFIAR